MPRWPAPSSTLPSPKAPPSQVGGVLCHIEAGAAGALRQSLLQPQRRRPPLPPAAPKPAPAPAPAPAPHRRRSPLLRLLPRAPTSRRPVRPRASSSRRRASPPRRSSPPARTAAPPRPTCWRRCPPFRLRRSRREARGAGRPALARRSRGAGAHDAAAPHHRQPPEGSAEHRGHAHHLQRGGHDRRSWRCASG